MEDVKHSSIIVKKDTDGNVYFLSNVNKLKPQRFSGNFHITFCKDCFKVTGKHIMVNDKFHEAGSRDKCPSCDSLDTKIEEVDRRVWGETRIGESPLVARIGNLNIERK